MEEELRAKFKETITDIICVRGADVLSLVDAKPKDVPDLIQVYYQGVMDGVRIGLYKTPKKAKEIVQIIEELYEERQ